MNPADFDDVEEMFTHIDQARDLADSMVLDWQNKAKPGMKFVRLYPEMMLTIYGEILDPIQEEINAGADEEEVEYARAQRAQPHMRHFRFANCFSEICPEGELGDVHISTIACFLTDTQFENARRLGWPALAE